MWVKFGQNSPRPQCNTVDAANTKIPGSKMHGRLILTQFLPLLASSYMTTCWLDIASKISSGTSKNKTTSLRLNITSYHASWSSRLIIISPALSPFQKYPPKHTWKRLHLCNFQVVDIRNGLSHARVKDNLYISDRLLEEFFNDIEECVDAIKIHQQNLKADEIKDILKQVRVD